MAAPADDPPRISQNKLGELVGASGTLQGNWATKQRLRKGSPDFDEWDAIEFAALRALVEALGTNDGPIAWKQLRRDLPAQVDTPDLLAIFDVQDKLAGYAHTAKQVRELAPYGHHVAAVDLADPIARVRRAFVHATEDA